jgi:hydroxypyruvate reductase
MTELRTRLADLRRLLESAFEGALDDLDPARLVEHALPPKPPRGARVRVIAVGKAAAAMARGAFTRWESRVEDALVVTQHADSVPDRATLALAGHPLPDERSVAAAEEALRRAGQLTDRDLLLALVSGGASALLAAPPSGVSLSLKRDIVAALLDAGAPIHDVNLVRRHFSRVKGGRLAAAAGGARVVTLYLCDVIGGTAHDVGSGPTVPDPTTVEQARAALSNWAPAFLPAALPFLSESVKPNPRSTRTRALELAEPNLLARTVAARLSAVGFHVTVDPPEVGDVEVIARQRVTLASSLAPGEAIVTPCEPTLALPTERGRGGRAGRAALLALRDLPEDVALLSAASDGLDGSSGHAGAIVSRDLAEGHDEQIDRALRGYDDASAHETLSTSLDLVRAGHNLADIHVIARLPLD